MKRLLGALFLAGAIASSPTYAGSIAFTPGSGGNVGAGTDGSFQIPAVIICGGAAATLYTTCASQLYIDSSGYAHVNITNSSLSVTGTFWQTTQPVSAASGAFVAGSIADLAHGQGTMAASVPVAIASNQSTLPVNTSQVNGVTTLTGSGAVGTGAQRVAVGTDTATIAGSAPGTAGTASANVLSVQGIASMTPLAANISQIGGTAVVGDPCQVNTPAMVRINLTSGTTKIITGTSGKHTYFCQVSFPPQAAAVNMTVIEGTGTNCGTITGTAGILGGGTTASSGPNIAANGGFIEGNGSSWVAEADGATGDDVCIATSAAFIGTIKYVQQ